jgi:RNA polymerase sigma-70 factor (ECF subfamily)
LEAWRDIGRFQGRSSLRTWLFGIATHRSLDALRARRARHKFVSEYEAKAIPDPGPMPDERLDNARLDHVLAECLAEILPSTRQAILMRFELGLTFDELAEICGEHPEALRARVTRALPVLRSRIEARLGIAGGGR